MEGTAVRTLTVNDLEKIRQDAHFDIVTTSSFTGRYYYIIDDIQLQRPYIAIDKSGTVERSDTFATEDEMVAWFNGVEPPAKASVAAAGVGAAFSQLDDELFKEMRWTPAEPRPTVVDHPIESSMLAAAAYDPAGRLLIITFKNGNNRYKYLDVPPELFEEFKAHFDGEGDHSAGKFFLARIKPDFTCEKIEAPAEPHWTDRLASEAEQTVDRQPEQQTPAFSSAAAQEITDKLVPAFGQVLKQYDPSAVAFGFPPAVAALIKKVETDPERTEMVLKNFREAFALAAQWEAKAFAIVIQDESETDLIRQATHLYEIVRDERILFEKERVRIKKPALRECQLIDGVSHVYETLLSPIESHLKAQSKFIENKEKERRTAIKADRLAKLKLFEADGEGFDLANMTDEAFELVYQGSISAFNTRKAAEAQAERDRVKSQQEAEAENLRLRAENERIAQEKAQADALAADERRKADEARQKQEAAEAELKRQEDARKAEEARLAAVEEAKRLAPDKEKIQMYFEAIHDITVKRPDVASDAAKLLLEEFFVDVAELVNGYAARAAKLGTEGVQS